MNKMREVTERGTVSLPFGRVIDPFECGIRVFVPRKYLPRFIADFFDSYPNMNIACAEIEERFGYFGRENPVKERGCWFSVTVVNSLSKHQFMRLHMWKYILKMYGMFFRSQNVQKYSH